jgi:hypothetical protein
MEFINNHVIFSFDENETLHGLAKFSRHLDTINALQPLKYTPRVCTGMWEGEIELSFCMDYNDFMSHLRNSPYIKSQDCFMVLNPRNPRQHHRQQATLLMADGSENFLGDFNEASRFDAVENGAYTYFHDTRKYFIV